MRINLNRVNERVKGLKYYDYQMKQNSDGLEVYVFDEKNNQSKLIKAKKVVNCAPQFVNQYLLLDRKDATKAFQYAPWMIATITLSKFPFADGAPLSWDNVIHQGKGLGYIQSSLWY